MKPKLWNHLATLKKRVEEAKLAYEREGTEGRYITLWEAENRVKLYRRAEKKEKAINRLTQ